MARLRERHLPHRVHITRLVGEGSEGDTWADPVENRPAYVEQKSKLVVDRRSSSSTFGQEITSTAFVILLIKDDVLPRSTVTIWPGTPRQRTSDVVESALFDYNGTPSHIELYLA